MRLRQSAGLLLSRLWGEVTSLGEASALNLRRRLP
jgi:hypothetical protein